MRRAVRVVIAGIVQGVGYRDWTRREAVSRGLSGWVRNRSDRTVEAVIAGDGVDAMLGALRDGPSSSRVKEVMVEDWAGEVPAGFKVRETT